MTALFLLSFKHSRIESRTLLFFCLDIIPVTFFDWPKKVTKESPLEIETLRSIISDGFIGIQLRAKHFYSFTLLMECSPHLLSISRAATKENKLLVHVRTAFFLRSKANVIASLNRSKEERYRLHGELKKLYFGVTRSRGNGEIEGDGEICGERLKSR